MNLADIRKKSEESRKPAVAASREAADESWRLPEMTAPESLFFEDPPENQMLPENILDEPCDFDIHSPEPCCSEPESAYIEELIHEPLPDQRVMPASGADLSLPVPPVTAPNVKRPVEYNPLETIISGRESVVESDEISISRLQSFASAEVEEYLCFRVAHEEYAISIMSIKEIIKPRDVTEVPRMPQFVTGVISLRGVIIPVMDMRLRLSLPVSANGVKERIIVVKTDSGYCGVLVDEVIQVARIIKSDIEEPPAVLDGIDRDFVTGLGHFDNRLLILLNLEAILDVAVH